MFRASTGALFHPRTTLGRARPGAAQHLSALSASAGTGPCGPPAARRALSRDEGNGCVLEGLDPCGGEAGSALSGCKHFRQPSGPGEPALRASPGHGDRGTSRDSQLHETNQSDPRQTCIMFFTFKTLRRGLAWWIQSGGSCEPGVSSPAGRCPCLKAPCRCLKVRQNS